MRTALSPGSCATAPHRPPCSTFLKPCSQGLRTAKQPTHRRAIHQEEWSLFERSEESTSQPDLKKSALLGAHAPPESSLNEENASGYIQLNRRLVKAASNVLHTIHVHGPRHSVSQEAAQKLVGTYEYLIQRHPVNVINCATLLHRLGSVFLALESTEALFEGSHRLIGFIVVFLSRAYRGLDARQIANIVWALGCIGRPLLTLPHSQISIPEVYSLLFSRMLELQDYRPQEIASCVSGLARMGFKPETCRSVMEHLTQLAVDDIGQFGPQELATVLWGLGCLLYWPSNDFIKAAITQMTSCLRDFSPKQMANAIWGFARLDVKATLVYLLPAMERFFKREVWNYREQGISVVLWSFAKLNYLPEKATLDKALHVAKQRLPGFSAQSVANICYACAIFGYTPAADVTAQFRRAFQENRSQFSPQLTCLLIWSLAVMFSLDLALFKDVMAEMGDLPWKDLLSESDMRQLYQCMIHAQFFIPGGNRAMERISPNLILAAQHAWEQGQNTKWTDAVCLAAMMQLQKLGYVPECHYLAARGLARFSVNLVHRGNSSDRVAVEITIPRHRFVNDAETVEGPRQWAMKLLRRKGFKILQIDAEIWRKLDPLERIDYLKQLLAELNLSRVVN